MKPIYPMRDEESIKTDKLCFETLMRWLLKVTDQHWEDKQLVLERIEEGYDLETMIHIYESRVEMTACSIEQDIVDTLRCLKAASPE